MIMKRISGLIGVVLGVIVLVMLALPFAFGNKATEFAQRKANERLLAKVSFDKIRLNLFTDFPNVSVSVPNIVVVGVDTFANDTLVKAKKVKLSVNLRTLLTKEGVSIEKIELDRPEIHALALANGKANWNIVKPDTAVKKEKDTTSVKIKLRKIALKNANIVYEDLGSGMNARIKNWSGTLKGNLASDRSNISTNSKIDAISFKSGNIPFLNDAAIDFKISVDANMKENKYTLEANKIKLNDMELSLNGYVQMPDTSTVRMDLSMNTGKISFKSLLSMIPALYAKDFKSLEASGNIQLSAFVKGDMKGDTYPSFNVKLLVENGQFKYPSLPGTVSDVNVNAHFYSAGGVLDNMKADISRFHFNMAGNPFDMTVKLAHPMTDPEIAGKVNGTIDLDAIKSIYPLEKGTSMKGKIQANASASGRLSYVEKKQYDKFSASGIIKASNLKLSSGEYPTVNVSSAYMTLSPRIIDLKSLIATIGANDLNASGKIDNILPWIMKKGKLSGIVNVNSNYLNLNSLMAKEKSGEKGKTANVNAASTQQAQAVEIPRDVDLTLAANGKKVIFDKLIMDNVSANVGLKNGSAEVNNLSANALGGSVAMKGKYELPSKDKPKVSFGINLKNVSYKKTFETFDMAKSLAPLFAKANGDFSMNMDFSSTLDKNLNPYYNTLDGEGILMSSNMGISGVKALDVLANTLGRQSLKNLTAKDLKIKFKIHGGKVKTSPFTINVEGTKITFEGTTSLDKSIDYDVKVGLPGNAYLKGVSSLKGRITGTFENPVIKLDAAELARKASMNIANELLKKSTGRTVDENVAKTKAELAKRAEEIRAKAKAEGDLLISQAEKEGNSLIEKAKNPIVKAAAKAAAERLKSEAKKKAAEIEAKAENEIQKLDK